MTAPIIIKPEDQAPTKHFEDIWETGEKLFNPANLKVDNILNELNAKLSLYRMLEKGAADAEELSKAKSMVFGKVLLALTKLSLLDNVNTFAALQTAVEEQKLSKMEETINAQPTQQTSASSNMSGNPLDILEGILKKAIDKNAVF
jgi:hypothetical protein